MLKHTYIFFLFHTLWFFFGFFLTCTLCMLTKHAVSLNSAKKKEKYIQTTSETTFGTSNFFLKFWQKSTDISFYILFF